VNGFQVPLDLIRNCHLTGLGHSGTLSSDNRINRTRSVDASSAECVESHPLELGVDKGGDNSTQKYRINDEVYGRF
jgi:hypothetical protein